MTVEKKPRLALHWQILISMVVGVVLGLLLRGLKSAGVMTPETMLDIAGLGEGAGKMFLALLSMVVVPLVFTSLVSSITGLRGQGDLKKLGAVTIGYYMVTSILAITVGIAVSNVIQPGAGVSYDELLAQSQGATKGYKLPATSEGSSVSVLSGIFFRMIPQNVVDSASSNRNMLAIIFFAIILGYFINKVHDERSQRAATLFEDFFEIMMQMTHGIIKLAPYGIAGYIMFVASTTGIDLVFALGKYMLTVFVGLSIHAFVTLPLLTFVITRRNPYALLRSVWPALATAFSTASSSGTLPLTIKCLNDAGVDKRVTSFVLPLGATINMDGTALYEAAAVLFIAQMLGDLSLAQQVTVAVTALLASVGAAGIPHAGTVMMVIVLEAVNLPTEAVLTILAVDRVLDMLRTSINVWSDSNATNVVDFLERRKAARAAR